MFSNSSFSFFVVFFFLNENCICCVTELSWKKSYSLAPAIALGGRAWSNSQCAHRQKRDLPNICTGSSCFCPLCWRRLPSDTCFKSYRTKCRFQSSYHSNQQFIRKIPYCKVESANSSVVRSFVSPRGTVQCSLYAHYKSVSKQQEGCDLHVKSVKLW